MGTDTGLISYCDKQFFSQSAFSARSLTVYNSSVHICALIKNPKHWPPYHSLDTITKMLKDLNLPSLQVRRRENCLIFLYKIAAGLIPTIPAESFLTPVRNKRQIKTTSRSNFTSSNIIKRLCQKQQPLLLFGQCKNKTPTETASSSELFLTGTISQKK